MPNDVLLAMSVNGDQEATEERLIREIMSVDNASWVDSSKTFKKVEFIIRIIVVFNIEL